MNYRSYYDMSCLIREHLSFLESKNFDLIVGIPRSGMIPAMMIALLLNKHCCNVEDLSKNRQLQSGYTRKVKTKLKFAHEARNILLVDDSINKGKSLIKELSHIPKEIRPKITTLAIYSSKKVRSDIDYYLEYLPLRRAFEWNIFHHIILEKSCFEIDGILCNPPTTKQLEERNYYEFLLNAKPLITPTLKIDSIVTSRLEKYRTETENWLNNNAIKYDNLIMSEKSSNKTKDQIKYKSEAYNNSGNKLFFESNRYIAQQIHSITKKPVFCFTTNEMFSVNK